MTLTRNSTGTRVNEDYLIEDVPYNLAKYSQDLSGGAWSNTNSSESLDTIFEIAPDGTADSLINYKQVQQQAFHLYYKQ